MKIAPVSGDFLVKAALVVAGIGLAVYLVRRSGAAVATAVDAVTEIADSVITGVNPANPNNVVNRAVNAVGDALVSDTGPGRNADGSWTMGSFAYDVLHPGWADNASGVMPTSPPPVSGGAAFGWFPQLGRRESAVDIIARHGRVTGGL